MYVIFNVMNNLTTVSLIILGRTTQLEYKKYGIVKISENTYRLSNVSWSNVSWSIMGHLMLERDEMMTNVASQTSSSSLTSCKI